MLLKSKSLWAEHTLMIILFGLSAHPNTQLTQTHIYTRTNEHTWGLNSYHHLGYPLLLWPILLCVALVPQLWYGLFHFLFLCRSLSHLGNILYHTHTHTHTTWSAHMTGGMPIKKPLPMILIVYYKYGYMFYWVLSVLLYRFLRTNPVFSHLLISSTCLILFRVTSGSPGLFSFWKNLSNFGFWPSFVISEGFYFQPGKGIYFLSHFHLFRHIFSF